jgi:hypothetical protein
MAESFCDRGRRAQALQVVLLLLMMMMMMMMMRCQAFNILDTAPCPRPTTFLNGSGCASSC